MTMAANPLSSTLFFPLAILFIAATTASQLQVGFYRQSCPNAERIVLSTVAKAYANNSGIAPGLIRMHFHDCFVRGCDGSVLLDGDGTEKTAVPNNPSLRGFEVVDAIKAALEARCPRTVSCADIIAFAARDSATLSGGIYYQVPAGRRDGNVSIAAEALSELPSPFFNASQLVDSFARKNLTADEMVTLSGAHTIGRSHCVTVLNRLYNFTGKNDTDPSLNPIYALVLKARCPANSSLSDRFVVPLDALTPAVLDNLYYVGLNLGLGLLTSDLALMTNQTLASGVESNAFIPGFWPRKFAAAMVRMGGIQPLTGTQGQIRTNCRVVNFAGTEGGESFRKKMIITDRSSCL